MFGFASPNWFMKSEYRVTEYDRKNVAIVGFPPALGISFKPYVQTVSTSLVYRFNAMGVPVATSSPIYTKASVAYNWTGFYLNGGGGYELWQADQQGTFFGTRLGPSDRSGGRGFFGMVGGGYDYQFARYWVAGIFADAQFGDVKGTISSPGFDSGMTNNNMSWAIGSRLGYLVTPNVLSYVNAGYTNGHFKGTTLALSQVNLPDTVSATKFNANGWFVGGGIENSLNSFGISAPGWFMKTEYRVAEYGRKDVIFLDTAGAVSPTGTSFKPFVQTISTSLVYRFNWSDAPISAN
jgi:outer membrane immunogenic protein